MSTGARYVLNHVGFAGATEHGADRLNELRMIRTVRKGSLFAVGLAWRRGMDRLKAVEWECHGVAQDELVAGVPRLRLVIYAHDVEARLLIATRSTTGATEQVKQPRLAHRFLLPLFLELRYPCLY